MALLAGLLVAPAVALGVATYLNNATPRELTRAPKPLLIEPTVRTLSGQASANLQITFAPSPVVVSSGATGLVTGVSAKAGSMLTLGKPVYTVDGVTRRLFVSNSPLFRSLKRGDSGADVRSVELFLNAQGYRKGTADTHFDEATQKAARSYRVAVGEREASGVFSPDLVVWSPRAIKVAAVKVRIGDVAPALGQPLISGASSVRTGKLVAGAGAGSALSGPRVMEHKGKAIGIVPNPDSVSPPLAQAVVDASIAAGALHDAGSVKVADQGNGDPARDGSSGSDGPNQLTVAVTVRFPSPKVSLSVPTSAVMVDERGTQTCVWVGQTAAHVYEALTVQVSGGELGTTDIEGNVKGRRVLANPAMVLEDPTCPSK